MWTSLVDGLGQSLTERSSLRWAAPAAFFWLGGVAALSSHDDHVWWRGGWLSLVPDHASWGHAPLPPLTSFLQLSGNAQIALSAAAVLLIGLSSLLGRAAALPVIRAAEGYWPRPLNWLRDWLARRAADRVAAAQSRLAELREIYDRHSPAERHEYTRLDQRLETEMPKRGLQPTTLGNVLRAAENQPADRYGLDTLVCWPRLWLIIPDATRQELTGARDALDQSAVVAFWGIAFLLWSAWRWWTVPVGLLAVWLAYRAMIRAATIYGELLVAAFDVHRFDLYRCLRWPLPHDPIAEREAGKDITQYLWRGAMTAEPIFIDSGPSSR